MERIIVEQYNEHVQLHLTVEPPNNGHVGMG